MKKKYKKKINIDDDDDDDDDDDYYYYYLAILENKSVLKRIGHPLWGGSKLVHMHIE